ncbi:hypothetical protein N0B31_22215 (plasmid) [Salinirubellus salinus]|uniref:DUF4129 domain-containing protein n=1 Tax=Salinirubellus salinus TaxID=1364945 RepID=A0A9E7R9J0_9EURY|nr:hypothetical protein [Salinirubellus salinus]UWM56963.1 hypothetical protein N0B31_22215 [Salinirubellus salinus]
MWRQRAAGWLKPLTVVCLAVLLIGTVSLPLTAVSAAQTDGGEGEAAGSSDNSGGLFGSLKAAVDRVWCWAFGCSEPVVVSQSETVVVEEGAPTRQAESSLTQTNAPADTAANATTNATVVAGGNGSIGEVVSDTPAGGGADAVEGEAAGASGQQSADSPRIVRVVSGGEATAAPWWWLLLVALFIFATLALIGLALYRRFGQTDAKPKPVMYPATLRPRVVHSKAPYTDGGANTDPPGAADTPGPTPVRLTDARAALDDGATDRSVTLAIQALGNASEQEQRGGDHEALVASWQSTAAEIPELSTTLDQLTTNYEQATFSPQPVPEAEAMTCIETVEALLTTAGDS